MFGASAALIGRGLLLHRGWAPRTAFGCAVLELLVAASLWAYWAYEHLFAPPIFEYFVEDWLPYAWGLHVSTALALASVGLLRRDVIRP